MSECTQKNKKQKTKQQNKTQKRTEIGDQSI